MTEGNSDREGMPPGAKNFVAIIQARMGSTRLPGKVLMDLGGKSTLLRVVHRLGRARMVSRCIVATTVSPSDDLIARECESHGVEFFRGSESDVLDRYYRAAVHVQCDAAVRITSDCPLIDPALVDETIRVFTQSNADYASNVLQRTYPRGLDTEVFGISALKIAWREAQHSVEREHVTPYFYRHPELFCLASSNGAKDYSQYRWTLDTVEDLQLLREIYKHFDNRDDFSWRDVLDLMERNPSLAQLNAHIRQKAVP